MSEVRIPKQHRSVQTKNRIVKAGFQLFSRKGIHGTTSKEIADKAGVAIGSFYAYFKNAEASVVDNISVLPVNHLSEVVDYLRAP